MFELLHMPRRKGAFSPLLSAKSYLGGIIGLLLPSLVLSLSLPIFLAADVATDDAVDAQQYEAPILLRVPPPCGCRHAPPGTGRVGPGIVPDGGRLAYLVEAHNGRTVDDALNLFRAIRYPGTIILFHIDTEFPPRRVRCIRAGGGDCVLLLWRRRQGREKIQPQLGDVGHE